MSDLDEQKQRTARVWGQGNYPAIAELLQPAALALVDACAISAGQEVLDVAAGNGNLALAAAREGASVVASDISPGMIELGRARIESEGFDVEWAAADVEDLPFEDERFDCVASVFGAMFAPRPERVAAELFRVVRAGGTVGMANWSPGGFADRQFEINAKFAPGPPQEPRPILWGDEQVVRQRFEGLAARVVVESRTVPFRFESAEAFFDFFEQNSPQAESMHAALGPDDYDRLRAEAIALFEEYAESPGGPIAIDSEYVLVVARKRG